MRSLKEGESLLGSYSHSVPQRCSSALRCWVSVCMKRDASRSSSTAS